MRLILVAAILFSGFTFAAENKSNVRRAQPAKKARKKFAERMADEQKNIIIVGPEKTKEPEKKKAEPKEEN